MDIETKAVGSAPKNHTFVRTTVNKVTLSIIETNPSNIKLVNLNKSSCLSASNYYGINGGFFDSSTASSRDMYNIAKSDGTVISDGNSCGNGVISYKGGTTLSYETARHSYEISGVNSSGTWSQGGALMSLGSASWEDRLDYPNFPNEANTLSNAWSALIVDREKIKVLLVATNTICKLETFRAAIQSYLDISDGVSDDKRYKGIFLDGGFSTELRAKNQYGSDILVHQDRKLMQIIALRNAN